MTDRGIAAIARDRVIGTSEFTIVAVVSDLNPGEASFTADQLQESLANVLSDLHLKVKAVRVLTPTSYAEHPGACGDECTCPSITGSLDHGDHQIPMMGGVDAAK